MTNRKLIVMPTLVALVVGLVWTVTSTMADTSETRKLISGRGGIGDLDQFTTFSLDGGQTFQPAFVVGGRRVPQWGDRIQCSKWINATATVDSRPGPYPVTIIFQRNFKLPRKMADPSLSVSRHADNGVTVFLNGNLVGAQQCDPCGFGNFQSPSNFVDSDATHFLKGQNVLEFHVTDSALGASGLDY